MPPVPLLDTGHRNPKRRLRLDEDADIQDAVLLRPDELLPVVQEDAVGERVHDQELGHAARLARLADPKPPSERLVESEIDRDRITARVEWCDDDPAVLRVHADLEELLDHLRLLWCQEGVAGAGCASYATIALHTLGR